MTELYWFPIIHRFVDFTFERKVLVFVCVFRSNLKWLEIVMNV